MHLQFPHLAKGLEATWPCRRWYAWLLDTLDLRYGVLLSKLKAARDLMHLWLARRSTCKFPPS